METRPKTFEEVLTKASESDKFKQEYERELSRLRGGKGRLKGAINLSTHMKTVKLMLVPLTIFALPFLFQWMVDRGMNYDGSVAAVIFGGVAIVVLLLVSAFPDNEW